MFVLHNIRKKYVQKIQEHYFIYILCYNIIIIVIMRQELCELEHPLHTILCLLFKHFFLCVYIVKCCSEAYVILDNIFF